MKRTIVKLVATILVLCSTVSPALAGSSKSAGTGNGASGAFGVTGPATASAGMPSADTANSVAGGADTPTHSTSVASDTRSNATLPSIALLPPNPSPR